MTISQNSVVEKHTGHTVVLAQRNDQTGRTDCKYRTDHDQQYDREHTHDILHGVTGYLPVTSAMEAPSFRC